MPLTFPLGIAEKQMHDRVVLRQASLLCCCCMHLTWKNIMPESVRIQAGIFTQRWLEQREQVTTIAGGQYER